MAFCQIPLNVCRGRGREVTCHIVLILNHILCLGTAMEQHWPPAGSCRVLPHSSQSRPRSISISEKGSTRTLADLA
jgi:hypothetical protein